MDLLLDTLVVAWLVGDTRRLSAAAREAITDPAFRLFLSAVTAWEITDLVLRGRLPPHVRLEAFLDRLEVSVLPLPAEVWRLASFLPDIHSDPLDRMLIGHALHSDTVLVTADRTIPKYPLRTLW